MSDFRENRVFGQQHDVQRYLHIRTWNLILGLDMHVKVTQCFKGHNSRKYIFQQSRHP